MNKNLKTLIPPYSVKMSFRCSDSPDLTWNITQWTKNLASILREQSTRIGMLGIGGIMITIGFSRLIKDLENRINALEAKVAALEPKAEETEEI